MKWTQRKPLHLFRLRRKHPLIVFSPLKLAGTVTMETRSFTADSRAPLSSCKTSCQLACDALSLPKQAARVAPSVCVCEEGGDRHTYGRVERKGALALEHPVSCSGDPDGGHVRDQQLSEVCSHLRIPASRTTVLRSLRGSACHRRGCYF